MTSAELNIREAMALGSPAARLDAIMNLYWHAEPGKRDVLFAVLAARVAIASRPLPSTQGTEA